MDSLDLTNARWRKSSFSHENGSCVEVAMVAGMTAVRDTKDQANGPVLVFPPGAWADFVEGLRFREFGKFDSSAGC